MSKSGSIPTYSETVQTAWAGVDRVFPPHWDFARKEGYVDTDARHFHLTTHGPRNAYSPTLRAANWILGQQAEGYIYARRRVTCGALPLDPRYIETQTDIHPELRGMPPVLDLVDEKFIPLNAYTGETGTIRQASLKYLVGAGFDDRRGNYAYGLQFTFMNAPDDAGVSWPQLRADYYHPNSVTEFRGYVDAYLGIDGLEPMASAMGEIDKNVALLRKCVQNALALSVPPSV